MDALRWILLLIGAAIVGGIWWSGHRRSRERDETLFQRAQRAPADDAQPEGLETDSAPDFDISSFERRATDSAAVEADAAPQARAEPAEGGTGEAAGDRAAADPGERSRSPGEPAAADTAPASTAAAGERLEALYVVAPRGERFIGSRLQELFEHHGFEHGELDIYHKRDAEGRTLFSVANLVEPGTFDPATMDTLSTPGLALFVRLPGPPSAEVAFDRMIVAARGLADALEARVLDQQHSTLTRQTEQHLRDRMREFDHLQQRGGR